jgi:hypothetical protein
MLSLVLAAGCFGQSTSGLLWKELPAVVVDRKVSIPLADGKQVKGEVLSVRDEGLVMDIERSSSKRFQRGQALVPREAVTTVKVIRERGPLKLVGGILGTVGGAMLVGVIAFVTEGTMAIPAAVTIWPACGFAGYYGGKAADRRTRTIHILPEGDIHD